MEKINPVEAHASDRRKRRKAATQRMMQARALRLALEHGIDSLEVERISEAADIAPRTFSHDFAFQRNALLAANEIRSNEPRAALAERARVRVRLAPRAPSRLAEVADEAFAAVFSGTRQEDPR